MAGSVSDEWMYNEVLDDVDDLAGNAFSCDLTRRASVDSTDLLDDVLTLPSALPNRQQANEDDAEMNYVQEPENGSMEGVDSRSARYNAEQMVKIVEARITSNKTSQSTTSAAVVGGISLTAYSREPNRKNSIFVGNMTWWTTDLEVIQAIRNAGLGEVKIIKFIENRTNGQSKGMAMVELANEALALGAPDKLQELVLHDKKIVTAYAGRLNIPQFEAKCQGKPMPTKVLPTTKVATPRPPLMPPVRPALPATMGLPPTLPAALRPPGFPEIPPYPPVLPGSSLFNTLRPPDTSKPTPHLNPAFLQDMSQGNNVAELFAKAAAQFQNRTNLAGGSHHKTPPISESEESDANQRNRAISSSAITRAMSDANEGDYDSAVDTLKMAITLIKQSITATSESSQMLLQSLQDCLQGIERQAADMKRSRSRDRSYESRDSRRHRNNGRSTDSSKHYRNRSRERRR